MKSKRNEKIIGYSERGILNALFYDMKFSNKGFVNLLSEFLHRIEFVEENLKIRVSPEEIDKFAIHIEQSLSDFGDSDLFILIEKSSSDNLAIFFEAKVTAQKKWRLEKHFEAFNKGEGKKDFTSNLFTQLYHKYILWVNRENKKKARRFRQCGWGFSKG